MANKQKAVEWMEKGKRVFRLSEPGHIYSIKNGEKICSCGKKVNWRIGGGDDYQMYKIPKNTKTIIAKVCSECCTELDGNYCNNCKVKWKFANVSKEENEGEKN